MKFLFVFMRWQIVWFWCKLEWKEITAEQNNKYWYKLFGLMDRRWAKWHFDTLFIPNLFVLFVSSSDHNHAWNICRPFEHWYKISKTFLGKTIISIGCLHSFQGLFYIVLTLEGYFVVTGARLEKQPEIPWGIRAHSTWPQKRFWIITQV